MEDAAIVALYWERNQDAIEQSRLKYGAYCMSVSRNILASPEDAEECVSDTWLCAWNAMPPQRPNALRMFFAKITRNLSFSRFRRLAAKKRGGGVMEAVLDELSEVLAGQTDVEETADAHALGETVRSFIRELPGRERDVFLRRYFFTESIREIAAAYGLTENHTSVILNRTRGKLRLRLIREGFLYENKRSV